MLYYESENYLAHHGIKNQKWGNRRFQNEDGSLTPEGRIRYGVGEPRTRKETETAVKTKVREYADKIKNAYRERKIEKHKAAEKKAEERRKFDEEIQRKKDEAEAKEKAENHEALMKHLREHQEDVLKYKYELDDADYARLRAELDFDQKLRAIKQEQIDRGWAKVKKLADNTQSIASLAGNATKIYNIISDTNNMLVDSGVIKNGKYLKRIGGNDNKNNNNNNNNNSNKEYGGNAPSKKEKKDFAQNFERNFRGITPEKRSEFRSNLLQLENNKKNNGTWTKKDEAFKKIVDDLSIKILNEEVSTLKNKNNP